MTDSRHAPQHDGNIFGPLEPARDAELGALLADVVGAPPVADVDWAALAGRIASARARQRTAWWSYAARWERRALPVALAAGLAGVLALWGLGMPATSHAAAAGTFSDPIAAMVDGTPAEDAARSFARSVTSTDDAGMVEAY
jgi:hypothetical protein